MKRMTVGAAAALLAALWGAAHAGADDPAALSPQPLPLRDVVLFSSGVGYFQRAGTVTGPGTVELSFRTEQVKDVLKSLVLLDPAAGVKPVSYTLRDAASRRLADVGRSLDRSISLGSLLRQFQGAQTRLSTGGEAIEGRIVSVNTRSVAVKEAAVQTDVLNILTTEGLRAVPLDSVTQVKLLDERLDRELRESLEALAAGLDDQTQKVGLQFAGQNAREIRVGYLQEMPVWKTSYRLVLDDKAKPYLQGWAQVENTSEEDWKDVRLSLISGRPVSFIQDLYQPLFVPRPEVAAQVIGSPFPQTYGEVLEQGEKPVAAAANPAGANGLPGGLGLGDAFPDGGIAFGGAGGGLGSGGMGGFGGGFGGAAAGAFDDGGRTVTLRMQRVPLRAALRRLFGGTGVRYTVDPTIPDAPITVNIQNVHLPSALRVLVRQAAVAVPGLTSTREGDIYVIRIRPPQAPNAVEEQAPPEFSDSALSGEGLAASVQTAAFGAGIGDLFQYRIDQPVSIARGKAAMVPIVGANVEGEKFSIYSPGVDETHALNGFRLKNNTGLHLSGGPITVFQGGTYAGDAQVSNLQPNEERLLSYAVDLELVAAHEQPKDNAETLSVSAKSGVLQITRKEHMEQVYTFRNKSDRAKTVLVEQAIASEFKIIEPAKPEERTAEVTRFRVEVPAEKSATLKVIAERPVMQELELANLDVTLLVEWTKNARLSAKLRAAVEDLVARRRRITDLQGERTKREGELRAIDQEQARIRQNMAQLDRTSALYQQYVKKLTDQESRIEALRGEIGKLQEQETATQQEMRTFVDGLTIT